MLSFGHSLECPCWINGEKIDVEGQGCEVVNVGVLVVEVLVTPVRLV